VSDKLEALLALVAIEVGEEPDQAHRQRREEERRADDRADRHVFGARVDAEQGDDRDQRLRHRRPHGRQQAPYGPLPHLQLVPDPLHCVGEQQRPGKDHRKAECKQEGFAHRPQAIRPTRRASGVGLAKPPHLLRR
jgi:hypothetical protein